MAREHTTLNQVTKLLFFVMSVIGSPFVAAERPREQQQEGFRGTLPYPTGVYNPYGDLSRLPAPPSWAVTHAQTAPQTRVKYDDSQFDSKIPSKGQLHRILKDRLEFPSGTTEKKQKSAEKRLVKVIRQTLRDRPDLKPVFEHALIKNQGLTFELHPIKYDNHGAAAECNKQHNKITLYKPFFKGPKERTRNMEHSIAIIESQNNIRINEPNRSNYIQLAHTHYMPSLSKVFAHEMLHYTIALMGNDGFDAFWYNPEARQELEHFKEMIRNPEQSRWIDQFTPEQQDQIAQEVYNTHLANMLLGYRGEGSLSLPNRLSGERSERTKITTTRLATDIFSLTSYEQEDAYYCKNVGYACGSYPLEETLVFAREYLPKKVFDELLQVCSKMINEFLQNLGQQQARGR